MTTMTKSFTKRKAQIKSSRYYLFWGIATIAVVVGQIYVGTGYRNMSKSLDGLLDGADIKTNEGMVYGRMYADWKERTLS